MGDWHVFIFIITGNFERFQHIKFETSFLETTNFKKKLETIFYLKVLRIKKQQFDTKQLCQKPMLRQTEYAIQNGPITKNGVLPATTL